jgi:hypothetical protein
VAEQCRREHLVIRFQIFQHRMPRTPRHRNTVQQQKRAAGPGAIARRVLQRHDAWHVRSPMQSHCHQPGRADSDGGDRQAPLAHNDIPVSRPTELLPNAGFIESVGSATIAPSAGDTDPLSCPHT